MSSDFLDSSRLNCMRHTCRPAEAKSIPVLAHCSYIGFRSGWVSYPVFSNERGGLSPATMDAFYIFIITYGRS